MLYHGNNGYANVPQCYIIRTLPVLLCSVMNPRGRRPAKAAILLWSVLYPAAGRNGVMTEPQVNALAFDGEKRAS